MSLQGLRSTTTQRDANMAEYFGPALEAWRNALVNVPLSLTTEALRFAGRRCEAQAEHIAALSRCGSVQDALKLQSDFANRTISDYQAEAQTVFKDVGAPVAGDGSGSASAI